MKTVKGFAVNERPDFCLTWIPLSGIFIFDQILRKCGQDIDQIADSACGLLMAQLEGRPVEKKYVVVPVGILGGQTL